MSTGSPSKFHEIRDYEFFLKKKKKKTPYVPRSHWVRGWVPGFVGSTSYSAACWVPDEFCCWRLGGPGIKGPQSL